MQTKVCFKCKEEKEIFNFPKLKHGKYGVGSYCNICNRKNSSEWIKKNPERHRRIANKSQKTWLKNNPGILSKKVKKNPEKYLYESCKKRSKKLGIDFNLDLEDIVIPEYCPILNIKLEIRSGNRNNSPSIDRINNLNGYIKGNIQVISYRANRIKNDGTEEEHRLIADYISKLNKV